jgi:hypothetical protein
MSDIGMAFDPYGDTIKSLDAQTYARLTLQFYGEGVQTDNVDVELSAFAQAGVCASIALLSEVHDLRLAVEKLADSSGT